MYLHVHGACKSILREDEADSKWSWSQDGEAYLIKSLMVYRLTLKLSALCLEEILISMSNNGLNSLSLQILVSLSLFY